MAQILAAKKQSTRLRPVGVLQASRERSAASTVQPPVAGNTMTGPVSELATYALSIGTSWPLTGSWALTPSLHQPREEDVELTNERKLPLPYVIDVVIDGETYACRYCGHGRRTTPASTSDSMHGRRTSQNGAWQRIPEMMWLVTLCT